MFHCACIRFHRQVRSPSMFHPRVRALYLPFVALPELHWGNLHFMMLPALTRLSLWFPHKRSRSVAQSVLLFLFHLLKVCKCARTGNKFQWSETKPVCMHVCVCVWGGCGAHVYMHVCVCVCVCVCAMAPVLGLIFK